MAGFNVDDVNAAVSLISAVVPQVAAAYGILKSIWQRTNPGMTEADFLTYLQQASQKNVDEAAVILTADGYVQDPVTGQWTKPTK
jgi:hypothetical protein